MIGAGGGRFPLGTSVLRSVCRCLLQYQVGKASRVKVVQAIKVGTVENVEKVEKVVGVVVKRHGYERHYKTQ